MAQKIWGPSFQEPTLFNSGMFKGAIVGHLLSFGTAALTALVFAPAIPIVSAATVLGGALIGGARRKEEIELENRNGKPVSEPSMFNEGFFSGFNKGMFLTKLVAAGLAIGMGMGLPLEPAMAGMLVLGGMATSAIAGLFTASSGKDRQQQEYATALEMQKSEEQSKGRGHAKSQSLEPTPEPVIGKHAEAALAEQAARGHAHHRLGS